MCRPPRSRDGTNLWLYDEARTSFRLLQNFAGKHTPSFDRNFLIMLTSS